VLWGPCALKMEGLLSSKKTVEVESRSQRRTAEASQRALNDATAARKRVEVENEGLPRAGDVSRR